MRIKIDTKKAFDMVSDGLQKTADISKIVAENVQQGAMDISEKAKNDAYQRKIKKYNPVFPDQYQSEEFNIPNMVRIVDDAVRRDVDVCEGAIGWLSTIGDIEILNLYDEALEFSGLQFLPVRACDEVYYVDNFDRTKFVRVASLFSRAQEEKLAELKHIAFCLGAKKCSIEIEEAQLEEEFKKNKFDVKNALNVKGQKASSHESVDKELSSTAKKKISSTVTAEFEGSDVVKMPELKWFKNDDNIKRLIESRTANANGLKKEELRLEASNSATISVKAATSIDNALGKLGGSKGSLDISKKAKQESETKLIFSVEF